MADDEHGGGSRRASHSAGDETCPGSRKARDDDADLESRMRGIRHKIIVLSGKGGVGKSTVAAALALMLSRSGKKVGLLDIDVHGPSIPRLLGLEGRPVISTGETMLPVSLDDNLGVMSIGFLLRTPDDAVVWRGPMKHGAIKQLLSDVEWGDLDYLIIDSPPGTGDEPLSVIQLIGDADGAVIVTTPQELALSDVRRSIGFCRGMSLPILGVVENMSGLVCPDCGASIGLFGVGGGEAMAEEMGVPFLGRVPVDPGIVAACDSGGLSAYLAESGAAAGTFARILNTIESVENPGAHSHAGVSGVGATRPGPRASDAEAHTSGSGASAPKGGHQSSGQEEEMVDPDARKKGNEGLRVAVPITAGRLSQHFGHCDEFAIVDVDTFEKKVIGKTSVPAPEHEPGLLPRWLREKGVDVILAGGMGRRARDLFQKDGIDVVVGVQSGTIDEIVESYLGGTLETGENVCDH